MSAFHRKSSLPDQSPFNYVGLYGLETTIVPQSTRQFEDCHAYQSFPMKSPKITTGLYKSGEQLTRPWTFLITT